jgi:ribosome-binding protein aMBF1 (putative translation factor)
MTAFNKTMTRMRAAAVVLAASAVIAAGPATAQAPTKELSDKSVAVLMEYAWTILPDQMRMPDRTIKVDKKNKKKETMVPVDTARDVIKAGYMSAQAQLCDMLEDQVANYDAMIRRERAKKTWTDEQLLYITTLHRMTIHMAAGKLRVVDKPDNEQQVILEAIEPSKDTCNDEKRSKVREQIVAYVKASPPPTPAATKKAEPAAPAAPQPTPAAAKEPPKK